MPDRPPHRDASLQTEVDAGYLYRALAQLEDRPEVAEVYRQMAAIEERHAESRRQHLATEGHPVRPHPVSRRARVLAWLARRLGSHVILSTLTELEKSLAASQVRQKAREGALPSGRESTHARVLEAIQQRSGGGMEGGAVGRLEGRHHAVGGNALRAAVLGANDGLVSNLSLVMGVAGAAVEEAGILIAGFAGLLAGSISMALGEWLSVQSSRELYERQIAIEAAELESDPEHEAEELALIYQAKGLSEEEAGRLGRQLAANPDTLLDTLVREELAIDPEELGGSAWEAALTSFALFAVGAIIPVTPFLLLEGPAAIYTSLGASAVGLFGIGGAITLLTGRSVLFSGIRQTLFGLAAAAVTFGIGHLLGVAIAG
ncbi:MAG: VIT1/CCC1 transporter family protein [Gemmatimonadota bacterium]